MFIRSLVTMLHSFVPSLAHSFISQLRKIPYVPDAVLEAVSSHKSEQDTCTTL